MTDQASVPTSAPAAAPEPPRVVHAPGEEAARAIEETRRRLAEAAEALASGDDERLPQAYELVAECADIVARGLWYLRRHQRELEGAPGRPS